MTDQLWSIPHKVKEIWEKEQEWKLKKSANFCICFEQNVFQCTMYTMHYIRDTRKPKAFTIKCIAGSNDGFNVECLVCI